MALFGFLGGKKTSVGLDIGSGIIKLVVIDHGGSEAELTKVATTEVAADAIVEGEVMDPGLGSGGYAGSVRGRRREAEIGGHRGGRPRRHRQENPDGSDERGGRPRGHPLGSRAARAVRYGQRGARLPDPRSGRRRASDERAARR